MELEGLRRRARELIDRGATAEGLATLEVGADRAATSDASAAASLLVEATQLALFVHGPDRAVATAARAVELAQDVGGIERQRAAIRLGDALSWAGRYADAAAAWRSASVDILEADEEMLAEHANALLRLGDPGAHDAAFRALVAARATADPVKTLDALGLVMVAEVRAGRLQEALAAAEQGLLEVEGSGTMDEVDAVASVAWVLSMLGDEPRCRAMIERAEHGLADRRMTAPGGLARGLLELSLGSFEEAVRAFESKLAGTRFGPVAAMTALRPFVAELVEAYARVGRLERGRRLLAATLPVALGSAQPRLVAPMRRAQGILEGDEDAFRHALDAHAGWDNPFEEARTRLAFGELLRRGRRRAEAREELLSAAAGLEHVGARLWEERALAELRLAGDRLPARRPLRVATPETLTRQEGEILELLVAGLSNRQIAERLVLSVKTVEGHLTTIYGKLGVSSRTQAIARRAGAERP
jgi:DNA-binding CsgD family transcriptional regulator